jgi:hypothetical protein
MSYLAAFQNGKAEKKKVQVVYSTFDSNINTSKSLDRSDVKFPITIADYYELSKVDVSKFNTYRMLNNKEQAIYDSGVVGVHNSLDSLESVELESYELIVIYLYHFITNKLEQWMNTKCAECGYEDNPECDICKNEKIGYVDRYINISKFITTLYGKVK